MYTVDKILSGTMNFFPFKLQLNFFADFVKYCLGLPLKFV